MSYNTLIVNIHLVLTVNEMTDKNIGISRASPGLTQRKNLSPESLVGFPGCSEADKPAVFQISVVIRSGTGMSRADQVKNLEIGFIVCIPWQTQHGHPICLSGHSCATTSSSNSTSPLSTSPSSQAMRVFMDSDLTLSERVSSRRGEAQGARA